MKKTIAVLPGDGIGPEVIAQGIKVIEAVCEKHDFECELVYGEIGASAIEKTGEPLPLKTIEICKNADAVLLGAIGDPKYDNDLKSKVRPEQGLLGLRKALDIYLNIRPVKSYDSLLELSPLKKERIKGADMVIYRELTSGIYFGNRGLKKDGKMAFDTCVYTTDEIERIAVKAFKAAQTRRKKVTLVDKANVLETSKLWRKVVEKVSIDFKDVQLEYMYIDNASMQLVLNPSDFDVILTSNMFGDILSDEASVIAGSIGLLPSASYGEDNALFEPVHGSYPQAADQNKANPIAAILSVALMFEYFNLQEYANDIKAAVNRVINEGISTEDLNPRIFTSCSELGDIIHTLIADNLVDLNHSKMSTSKSVII